MTLDPTPPPPEDPTSPRAEGQATPQGKPSYANTGPEVLAEPSPRVVFVFVLMVVGLYLAAGPLVRLSEWRVRPENNFSFVEAQAWRAGRLDMPVTKPNPQMGSGRPQDTAYRDGKIYNVFPPLFTFISYAALAAQDLNQWVMAKLDIPPPGEAGASEFPALWYVALVALPLPILGFWGFRAVTGRSEWAAVLTAYWILGTPLMKMLFNTRWAGTNELNHVLSSTGLMLIAGDLLGKRRIWPAALGLLIGLWTRQLTVFYLLAMVWIVWTMTQRRRRGLILAGAAAVIGLGTLAGLNWAKFGSPLDSGYMLIYQGRDDMYARPAKQYGLFDLRFVPNNLFYMNLQPPQVRVSRMTLQLTGDGEGTSIWLASPLLIFALLTARRWWRDPPRRALMLSSALVICAFLCYHTTGSVQHGFHRFSMDFIPVWLMVIAPYMVVGRRRWITLGCLAYSALYFHVLCTTGA